MKTVLTDASIVTGICYIACVLLAIPPRRWALSVQKAAVGLAITTSVLAYLSRDWVYGSTFAVLTVPAILTLLSKQRTIQLRESLRRWDA